jgi:hypothetical protein
MFDGEDPQELAEDLDRLAVIYGPKARAASVRTLLRRMPEVRVRQRTIDSFDPPLLLAGSEGIVLTPEGRMVLQKLVESSAGSDVVLSADLERELTARYRAWSQANAVTVLGGYHGQPHATRPPALGLVALLILLEARDFETALRINYDMPTRAEAALREIIVAFVQQISTKRARLKEPVWKWPISRAQARFAGVNRQQEHERQERFWIDDARRQETLSELAKELLLRRRSSPERALSAIQSLAKAYDRFALVLHEAGVTRRVHADHSRAYDEVRQVLKFPPP